MIDIRDLTTPEIDMIINNCNLTEEEISILRMVSKGKSIVSISLKTGISTASVSRRIAKIKKKVNRFEHTDL